MLNLLNLFAFMYINLDYPKLNYYSLNWVLSHNISACYLFVFCVNYLLSSHVELNVMYSNIYYIYLFRFKCLIDTNCCYCISQHTQHNRGYILGRMATHLNNNNNQNIMIQLILPAVRIHCVSKRRNQMKKKFFGY